MRVFFNRVFDIACVKPDLIEMATIGDLQCMLHPACNHQLILASRASGMGLVFFASGQLRYREGNQGVTATVE